MKGKRNKTELLHVKVTPEERGKFRKLAETRHTDLSELIRQLLHREADAAKQQAA